MSEFKFPKLVVHQITEEEGRKYRTSVTSPVCDFCFDERVKWDYKCEDFVLDASTGPWASSNGWAACETCSDLVEAGEWGDLIERVLDSWSRLGYPVTAIRAEDAEMIVDGFSDHYTPGRVSFG